MPTPAEHKPLFTCPVRDARDILLAWRCARRSAAAARWPAHQQMQVAVLCCELVRLAHQAESTANGQAAGRALHVTYAAMNHHAALHLHVGPLPRDHVAALTAASEAGDEALAMLCRTADHWQVVPLDDDDAVQVRATFELPATAAVPLPIDAAAVASEPDVAGAMLQLFTARNRDLLRLARQVEQGRTQQEQLTREIEETNRGVVALYGELEDQTQKLQELNATLEQRVAERTAEVEKRATQLRGLASQLTQAEHRERRRIAQLLHDGLQQLIVASKMRLAMLQDQVPDEPVRQSMGEIDALLNETLQASRNLTIELAPPVLFQANLKVAMEWLAERMRQKHGLHVQVFGPDIESDVPEDLRAMLFQATQELLFNVVKHAGTRTAQVVLEMPSADELRVSVVDQGSGFNPRDAEQRESEPSGFGLFSIRERLDWFGGWFEVDGQPGEGTRITMAVPVVPPDGTPSESLASPAATPAAPEADRPTAEANGVCRVLLVDDHRLVREGLRGLIDAQPDMQVVDEAGDGQEAVDLALKVKPHVVLMDVNMPVMNGVEATRRIKAHHPETRVLALSMHEAESVAREMHAVGASGYISKDEAPETLCDIIRRTYREPLENQAAAVPAPNGHPSA